ncbi:deleted in azoospermia like [Ictidomys tridecemlineatus]|nr:deleted in azoospermia like [Ictidomys tridecemlineatus]
MMFKLCTKHTFDESNYPSAKVDLFNLGIGVEEWLQGRGRCHPLAEAAATRPHTRRRSHLQEPRRPRLSPSAPLSLAAPLQGYSASLLAPGFPHTSGFGSVAAQRPGRRASRPLRSLEVQPLFPRRAESAGTAGCRHHGKLRERPEQRMAGGELGLWKKGVSKSGAAPAFLVWVACSTCPMRWCAGRGGLLASEWPTGGVVGCLGRGGREALGAFSPSPHHVQGPWLRAAASSRLRLRGCAAFVPARGSGHRAPHSGPTPSSAVPHFRVEAGGSSFRELQYLLSKLQSAANSETTNSTISREASTQSSSATTSQGYVLPEGKIMPNTVFVGGIDVRMDETEIRSFFARYGSVKEVKIITDRTGVSKGYGFVSFYNDVDVQKIVESQINFHGKKLKLGPAIRKQNLCAYHVQPRPLIFNPPPPPQFQSVWSNPNTETYMQPPTMMNPITQYVQAYPPYPSSPVQVITGYQLPVYNYQMPPQWPAGEQRSYIIPPGYTAVNYHCNEVDPGAEVLPNECSVHEATPSSGNGPQKKSVDRSIQTVVSCLFNPENRLRNSLVTQDDYFKDKRVHHFRRSRAVLKSV